MNKHKKILLLTSALLMAIPSSMVIADSHSKGESYSYDMDDDHNSYHKESRSGKKERKYQKKEMKKMYRMMRHLDLTKEQEEQMENLMKSFSDNHKNGEKRNGYGKESRYRGMTIGLMSEDEINQMADDQAQQYKDSLMKRYAHSKAFLDILTDEQQNQLKEGMDSKKRYK